MEKKIAMATKNVSVSLFVRLIETSLLGNFVRNISTEKLKVCTGRICCTNS